MNNATPEDGCILVSRVIPSQVMSCM